VVNHTGVRGMFNRTSAASRRSIVRDAVVTGPVMPSGIYVVLEAKRSGSCNPPPWSDTPAFCVAFNLSSICVLLPRLTPGPERSE
jgi:hypothetical protein